MVDDGEVFAVNVRGIDSNRNSVTIDGSKMATSGPLDRQFRFLNISAGFFEEIEVTKAPTPDMEADSLGGAINMKTRSTLSMKERRSFTYRIGAKWAAPFWTHIPYRQDRPLQPSAVARRRSARARPGAGDRARARRGARRQDLG